jgi:hypothetical protein
MAILVRFSPPNANLAKYNEALDKLKQAGVSSPAGRLYHVCFGDNDKIRVSEIWDSKESFEKFGPTLMPILGEVGIDPGQPEFVEVYNIIESKQAAATTT